MTKKKEPDFKLVGGPEEKLARIAEIIDKNGGIKIRLAAHFYDPIKQDYVAIPGGAVTVQALNFDKVRNLASAIRQILAPGEKS